MQPIFAESAAKQNTCYQLGASCQNAIKVCFKCISFIISILCSESDITKEVKLQKDEGRFLYELLVTFKFYMSLCQIQRLCVAYYYEIQIILELSIYVQNIIFVTATSSYPGYCFFPRQRGPLAGNICAYKMPLVNSARHKLEPLPC